MLALISLLHRVGISRNEYAIICHVRSLWWAYWLGLGRARAATLGHIVILGPKREQNDDVHELVHVRQAIKMPLIFPIVYFYERVEKGYYENRFEKEAYKEAGNVYKGKL